jgi:hypothetical protein
VNNAGAWRPRRGHFLLTKLLMPALLKGTARTSSASDSRGPWHCTHSPFATGGREYRTSSAPTWTHDEGKTPGRACSPSNHASTASSRESGALAGLRSPCVGR